MMIIKKAYTRKYSILSNSKSQEGKRGNLSEKNNNKIKCIKKLKSKSRTHRFWVRKFKNFNKKNNSFYKV